MTAVVETDKPALQEYLKDSVKELNQHDGYIRFDILREVLV